MNKDYLIILENNQETFIFNKTNSKSIKINSQVYKIIEGIENSSDIKSIGVAYAEEDREFFDALAETFQDLRLLKDDSCNELLRVDYIITDFCNLKCTHCCYSAFYVENEDEKYNITGNMEVLKAIVNLRPKEIGITGGEPLIINNFSEITTYLQEHYNGSIALATNATLISEENVIQIVDTFDVIDISIDGINEEKCDAIRGEGTYRKVLTAIELLKRNGAKNISLSITLDNDSAGDREYFEAMCKKMEVEAVVRNMNLVGRAADNHKDSDQICDFMDVSTSNISQCYDCPGGVNEISVNYQGNIYPCNLFVEKDYEIGNILDENFIDKLRWDKKENWFNNFSEFIPDTRKECENCEVNSFCWDCPALAKTFLQNNDIDKLTDICGHKYKIILEEIWNE